MIIGYIGNFEAPFSTENDIKWSLEDMGHIVIPFQENKIKGEDIYRQIAKLDALFYTHTHGWNMRGSISIDRILNACKIRRVPTVSLHLDTWYGLSRQTDVGRHPFWKSRFVFTADGDPNAREMYEKRGINHIWSQPAVVKRDCYISQTEKTHDIIFVGSGIYHREWPYRGQLINWLKSTYGNRFEHYGQGGLPNVRGPELNNLYASSKIVIGDSLCLNFTKINYWSDRVYETIGRGGFIIHPDIGGMRDYLEGGEHLVYYDFNDFKQLEKSINFYLAGDKWREYIRLKGHDHVKQNHTYNNRLERILSII